MNVANSAAEIIILLVITSVEKSSLDLTFYDVLTSIEKVVKWLE
jgi:hypothetical protein